MRAFVFKRILGVSGLVRKYGPPYPISLLLNVQPPLQNLNVNWRKPSNLLIVKNVRGVNRAERLPQLAEIARWLPLGNAN
jgi:hypothetical protein